MHLTMDAKKKKSKVMKAMKSGSRAPARYMTPGTYFRPSDCYSLRDSANEIS